MWFKLKPQNTRVSCEICVKMLNVCIMLVCMNWDSTARLPAVKIWITRHLINICDKLEKTSATQDTMRTLDVARKGFSARFRNGESFTQNAPPKYIKNKGLFNVYLNDGSFRVTNYILQITWSKYFRNDHNGERFLSYLSQNILTMFASNK